VRPGVVGLVSVLFIVWNDSASGQNRGLCPQVLAKLVPQRIAGIQDETLPRVEVRTCPRWGDSLQLAGWERDATAPALIVDTTDGVIGQMVASGDVFVIETEGGSRSWVYVIEFRAGKPQLVLQQGTKGIVYIRSDYLHVEVEIEDFNRRVKVHRFNTGR
jgi:hypothetical protein